MRASGIGWMESIDSTENHGMNELAGHLGTTTIVDSDDSVQVLHQVC